MQFVFVLWSDFVCYICGNTHSIKPYILYRFLQTLNNSIKYIFFLPRLKNYNMKKGNKNPKTMACSYVEYDRLSNLSDDLIYCILSFLSTKESYRTCVLSIDGGWSTPKSPTFTLNFQKNQTLCRPKKSNMYMLLS